MCMSRRSALAAMVYGVKALLEREYGEQLDGVYDIRMDGTIAAEPGSHLDADQLVHPVERGRAV